MNHLVGLLPIVIYAVAAFLFWWWAFAILRAVRSIGRSLNEIAMTCRSPDKEP